MYALRDANVRTSRRKSTHKEGRQNKSLHIMAFVKKQYNEKNGVYFPQAVTVGRPVDTEKVAERLAAMSTVSRADVMAVLTDLAGVMADYMAQGKSVRLDGLGTFRLSLDTVGVADEADYDVQKQIKAVRVQFNPERRNGASTRGPKQRDLVADNIEWLPIDGSGAAGETADEDEDAGSDADDTGGGEALG